METHRIRKVGRSWHYRPTVNEMRRIWSVWSAAVQEALESTGQSAPLRIGPPTCLIVGGGAWPAVNVYLDPPRKLTMFERLHALVTGDFE